MTKKILKLNQTEFAAHIGVVKSYVTELKKAGRLVFTQDGKVDVEASLMRIKETADPNRDDVTARHAANRGGETPKKEGNSGKEPKAKKLIDPNHVTFSDGRAKEQHFKALQAELEYKKTIGELVSKKDMQDAVTDMVTTFRQALENLPHRVAADLVGKDIDFIRATLRDVLYQALAELHRTSEEKINQVEQTL